MRAQVARLGRLIKALLGGREQRSPAFRQFWFSFYEERDYPRHRLDVEVLVALQGRERDLAERMLINALPDLRAVVGLGELVSIKAAPKLKALFEAECGAAQGARIRDDADWRGARLIATAEALWRIEPCPRYTRALIGRLRHSAAWSERMDAAAALARMAGAEVEAALNDALDDPDALVRHHAARSLLALHGVEVDARAAHRMVYGLMGAQRRRDVDFIAALLDDPCAETQRMQPPG
ncbi:MAG: hypothetical protein KGM15_03020 [Pseudomonadota bacterium]|nr:hypothetical protein [Pseudomonadota bacterium]